MDVPLNDPSSTAAQDDESYLDADDCPTPTLDEHILDGSDSDDVQSKEETDTDLYSTVSSDVKNVVSGSSQQDPCPSEIIDSDHAKHVGAEEQSNRDDEILQTDISGKRGIEEDPKPGDYGSNRSSGQTSKADANDVESISVDHKTIENKNDNSESQDTKPNENPTPSKPIEMTNTSIDVQGISVDDIRFEIKDNNSENQDTKPNEEPKPSKPIEITNTSIADNTDQSFKSLVEDKMNPSSLMNTSQNKTNSILIETNSSSQIVDDTSERKTSNQEDTFSNKCTVVTKESSVSDNSLTASPQNDFKCMKCSFITSEENQYKTHVCQTSPNVGEVPKEQQITISFDNGNFFCSACDFKAKGHSFEEHLMCHLNVKPYQCIYCPEAFVNRRQMSQHVSERHTGNKMNCALKALSRAKRLMAEAQKTNSCVFSAKVPGRVPLQIDPHEKTKVVKEKPEMSKSDLQTGSTVPVLSNTHPEKQDNQDTSNKTKDKWTMADGNDHLKDVKFDTTNVTYKHQENETVESGNSPVLGTDNQVLTGVSHISEHKQQINTSVDEIKKDTNKDFSNVVKSDTQSVTYNNLNDSSTKVTSSIIEDVPNLGSQEMESVEDGQLNKDQVDPERNDKITLQSVVEMVTEGNEMISQEMEVEGTSETDRQQPNGEQMDIVKPYDTMATSTDKEESSLVHDSSCVNVESLNSLDSESQTTHHNHEYMPSKVTDQVSEKDSNKEFDLSEKVADGPDSNKNECENIQSTGIKETSEMKDYFKKVNDDRENADISPSVEDNLSGNACEESEDVPHDGDGMQVTRTSDVAEEADALTVIAPREADSVANNVKVLKDEHDSDVLSSKEHQDTLQADPSDPSIDSQKYLSSILVSQESTGDIDIRENIHCENNDGSVILETETGDNSCGIDNGNMMMDQSDSSSDVDEGQELKIIDSFSLDKDDNSFSESFGSKFTSEETAVLDEVCVKTNENNFKPSTSDDDKDELPAKCSAEQTTNSSVPFVPVAMETMNADNDTKTNCVKSPDEIQALPFSTVEKSVTLSEAQATPKPVSLKQDTKHMRNPNFYVCGLECSFSCLNSIEFRDHLLLEHAGEVSFPCYYCGYVAHSEDGLLKHMINHAHTYNKAAPLYYCGVGRCKFGTNLLTDFLNHMQIMHSDCAVFKCKECDHLTDSIENLVKHFDENYLHVVNCPHCTCKGSDRRVILQHIAQYHPGKAKMVQVAKQMICKERKQNNFYHDQTPSDEPESEPMPVTVTEIKVEQQTANPVESFVEKYSSKLKMKKGETVDRHIDPPKCDHCTFVARDTRRLQSHLNCHCLPQKIKRHRFRCIYCPQGFDASAKFKSHIACHPGLIKYWIFCCRHCEFDTNQRHVILKHIKTKDDIHMHRGEDEDMFSVVERVMESRVLECDRCNFQTRHKLHLQIHCGREHQIIKAAAHSSTDRDSTPPAKSSAVSVKRPVIQVPQYNKPSRNISLTAVSSGQVKENQLKKFKCPHCQYLVPKAADLKQHVKRHDYLGKISLHIFRCKYCSSSSTARDLVFEHIRDKHPGKALQLMRKTVDIDTQGTDNTFSETSVAEAPISSSDYNPQIPAINPVMPISSSNPVIDSFHCETCSFSTPSREAFDNHLQLHNTKGGIKGVALPEEDSDEEDSSYAEMKQSPDSSDTQMEAVPIMDIEKILQVVIVPECVATDTLTAAARCPQCYFASGYRSAFVSHVKSRHPEVIVVMRNNSQVQEVTEVGTIGKPFYLPEDLSPEVLVIPEKQVFSQAVGCPKCPNFATYFRRNLVLHIQRHHSEVTAMGLSSWNGWRHDNAIDIKTDTLSSGLSTVQDESCIIGSGNLDEKVAMLYENYGANHKCLICTIEKSKKYFMHIHLLRHLDISLWKCAFCAYQGLEKHKIKQHIKEHHPEKPTTIVYVKVDIDMKVSDFLKQLGLNRNAQTFLSVPEKAPLPEVATASSSNTISTTLDSKMKMSGPLGTSELDEKIRCLYETVNNKSMCILCSCEFTRKFAIHRHIITNHLKVALIGCGYCDFTGVDKHYITDHILMQHPKAPINVVTLDVDIPQKVTELLSSPNPGKRGVSIFSDAYRKSHKSQQVVDSSPKAYFLGKDLLDQKLQCLYKRQPDGFKCKMCEWKFSRKYKCHRHLFLKHLKINLFGCAYCHAKAVERYIIISHIKDAHPGSPPHAQILKVDIDQKISELLSGVSQAAPTPSKIQRNTNSHPAPPEEFLPEQKPDISDDIKPADTSMVVALFGRKRKDSDPVLPSVLSPVSPKKLKTTCRMTDVTTNINVICVAEGSIKKYVCEVCRFTSLHRSNVYRHVLRVHEKYREQECQYCGYKTLSVVLMKQHIDIEHEADSRSDKLPQGDKKDVVKVKQEQMDSESQPTPDAELYHKDSASTVEKSPSVPHTIKTYCCAYCDYETHTSENILKHTKELHCQNPDVPSSSSTTAMSSDSSASVYSRPVLKTNIKKGMFSANQYLNCGYCSFRSASLPDIKAHAKLEHRSDTALIVSPYAWRYICKICSLKNSAGGKMKNHINRHIEYRPYTCGSCGTSYSSSDELRKHTKNYQHADNILYIKNDKKEKKVNQLMVESQRCAEMVNLGTPFKFDSDLPSPSYLSQDGGNGKKVKPVKRMYNKPSVKKITSTWKTESLGSAVKFKFVKKKQATAQKTKFRYAQNCPFAKKVPIRVHPRKDSSLVYKDSFSCTRCSFKSSVSLDEVRKHHREAHPDKEFIWHDGRLQLTCTESGAIVKCPSQMKMPPADEQFTHKQLRGKGTKFYCNHCDFSCWVLQAVKSHIRMHQPRRFICPYCQMRYHKR